MNEKYIRDRITQLRLAKKVSERGMSLDLGHSTSYVRSITSGRAMPAMSEFLYICEYFGITPKEFFDDGEVQSIVDDLNALDAKQRAMITALIKSMKK